MHLKQTLMASPVRQAIGDDGEGRSKVVRRKLKFEKKIQRWSPEQVLQWLHFLTEQALERQSLVFSIEDLRATWLSGPHRRLYRWSLRLLIGMGSGLLFGLGCELLVAFWTGRLSAALLFVVISGLLFGGLCSLLFKPDEGLRPEVAIPWRRSLSKGDIALTLFCGLCMGTTTTGYIAFAVGGGFPLLGWLLWPCLVLLTGLPFGLFFPCWEQLGKSPLASNKGGSFVYYGLFLWLVNVLLCGLSVGLFGGIPFASQPQTPLGWGLFIVVFFWLCCGLLPIGLVACLSACLAAGPAMFAQPLLLRLFLRLCKGLPWDLLSVLEQGVEAGLLRKAGDSYRLSPRLLLSYFDSLNRPIPAHVAALQDQFAVSSFPASAVCGQSATIIYDGLPLVTAQRVTMHWSHNGWKGITDTAMTRERDGTWQATITVPSEATVLNMAFYDQCGTWDNHQRNDYCLSVQQCLTLPAPLTRSRVSRRSVLIGLGAFTVVAGEVGVWRYYWPYPLYTYRGHTDVVNTVAWSPDGRRIASASFDDTMQVWDAADGRNVLTYRGYADSVTWSPDSQRLAFAFPIGLVQVWDAVNGRIILTYRGHTGVVNAVVWVPNGSRLASASSDKTVRIWDAADGRTLLIYRGHTDTVNVVVWSPDGSRLASASEDRTVQIWDAANGRTLLTYRSHPYSVAVMAWSPDGSRLATCSDGKVQVWDVIDGRTILTYRGHTSIVYAVAWSPDSQRLASVSEDETVQVWDAANGRTLLTYRGHTGIVNAVAWSPDGRRLASAGADKTVQVWDAP